MNTLVNNSKKFDFNLIFYTKNGCILQFQTQFINNDCGGKLYEEYVNKIQDITDSIIIYGGRFPLRLTEQVFDNGYVKEPGEYGDSSELTFEEKKVSIISTISSLVEKNNKVILIYPIPEQGWNVYDLYINGVKKWNENLGYSYEIYKSRTASSFEVLDSVVSKDVYRVYPDKLLCNSYIKNECAGKFEDKIFYIDDDHLSPDGEQLLSEEILKTILEIKSK